MAEHEGISVRTISNPHDLVEKLTGVRPDSGICILCKNALVSGIDTDHSVCNSCWTETFKHKYEPYDPETEWTIGNRDDRCGTCYLPLERHRVGEMTMYCPPQCNICDEAENDEIHIR